MRVEREVVVDVKHAVIVIVIVRCRVAVSVTVRVEGRAIVQRASVIDVQDVIVVIVGVVVVTESVAVGVDPLVGVAWRPVDDSVALVRVVVAVAVGVVIEVVGDAVVVVVRVDGVAEAVAVRVVLRAVIQRVVVVPVRDAVVVVVIVDRVAHPVAVGVVHLGGVRDVAVVRVRYAVAVVVGVLDERRCAVSDTSALVGEPVAVRVERVALVVLDLVGVGTDPVAIGVRVLRRIEREGVVHVRRAVVVVIGVECCAVWRLTGCHGYGVVVVVHDDVPVAVVVGVVDRDRVGSLGEREICVPSAV